MSHRRRIVPLLVLAACVAAILFIVNLQLEANTARKAQVEVGHLRLNVADLQFAAFRVRPELGGSPNFARGLIDATRATIDRRLEHLHNDMPVAALAALEQALTDHYDTVNKLYAATLIQDGGTLHITPAIVSLATEGEAIKQHLHAAAHQYDTTAVRAQQHATIGSIAVILLLGVAFVILYVDVARARNRAVELAADNRLLLATSRQEALTDALTGLANRRSLVGDLDEVVATGADATLALYDLDRFKLYNDTYGHPAGDALLMRLAAAFAEAIGDAGSCYRLGGDEFCVLGDLDDERVRRGAAALTEQRDRVNVGCSFGTVRLPSEAAAPGAAMRIADRRLYAHKASRRESADVLLTVLAREEDMRSAQETAT